MLHGPSNVINLLLRIHSVSRYRASRDVPLPYELGKTETEAEATEEVEDRHSSSDLEAQHPPQLPPGVPPMTATGADPGRRQSNADPPSGSIRQRRKAGSHEASPMVRAITRVGTLLRASHAQDFERRRKSEVPNTLEGDEDDDDDTDEDNGATIDEDEMDGSVHRAQNKKDSNGNGKAHKQTEDDGDDDDDEVDGDEEAVGSGSGSGSGGEGGASSASDDQEIARARVLRQGSK